MIDLRSDTVTKPSPAMLKAMASAEVGDDVFGEDPSINLLEKIVAERFGMEAAIYCPSGTMTNQIAIKCHTQPGDEVVVVWVERRTPVCGGRRSRPAVVPAPSPR